MTSIVNLKAPKILVDSIEKGDWKSPSPDALRRCLGEDLDDLHLFESFEHMNLISENLDDAGFVDHQGFCMTRDSNVNREEPRLNFARALFIGGSINLGDDVFVAIQQEELEEYDPAVLVLDWRKSAPNRWTERGKLSDLITAIRKCAKSKSPAIMSIEWGKIEIDGLGTFRDAKLYPGGGRAWDWGETDTHHVPGIQPSDIQELLDNGSEFIVLSRGMQLVLQTCPETIEKLEELSIPFAIEETSKAVASYNAMVAEGKAVGGLFHSTC